MMEDAQYCVVAFGIASRVAKNAVVAARAEGIKVGLIRPITLWPFPKKALAKAADQVDGFISVELNMGQMTRISNSTPAARSLWVFATAAAA